LLCPHCYLSYNGRFPSSMEFYKWKNKKH
jgi:hypothetical protein